jgi:7-keto-8-aminopelargonate synthetase-like enzyme
MRSRHDRILDLAERRLSLGVELGVIQRRIEDERLDGALITLDGRKLVNFSSCAYLALNRDDRLKRAAIDAIERYGTSYSSSPTYTALPLYDVLEERLREMTGGAVAVVQTTTLAHLAALPVLIGPDDLALVDAQTHDSVHLATRTLIGGGVAVESIPHNDVEALERRVAEAVRTHHRVWFLADGVYSMFGDVAPVREIASLQVKYPTLHVYYDDAHGFGWAGRHGRGYVLSQTDLTERLVVSAGFAKSFGAVGAVLAFGDRALARRVRLVGGPLTFSGPIPPPDLGAAAESARIHLTPELVDLQDRLRNDIRWVRSEIVKRQLPLVSPAETPIWFIHVGGPERVGEMIQRLIHDGFYVNAAAFPAVPVGQGGIRFTQTLHNTRDQIEGLLSAIQRHLPEVGTEIEIDLRDHAMWSVSEDHPGDT